MDFVFNIAKGRVAHLASLPAASDGLIAVVLDEAGVEDDDTLMAYDTLGALLGGASNEHAVMTRQALTTPVVAVDDVNNWQSLDADNPSWVDVVGDPFAKLLICYVPDTGGGTDADIIPLVGLDWPGEPVGTTITANFNAGGIFRAE